MNKSQRNILEKTLAIVTLLGLVLAWGLGSLRQQDHITTQLMQVVQQPMLFNELQHDVWAAKPKKTAVKSNLTDSLLWVGRAESVGYGGMLQTIIQVNEKQQISGIAIIQSAETPSYLKEVISNGLIDNFVDQNVAKLKQLDGITGATLTSNAINHSIIQAAKNIGINVFKLPLTLPESTLILPQIIDGIALLIFIIAIVINRPAFPHKIIAKRIMMGVSIIVLGFYAAAPYGANTLGFVLSGVWLDGIASYTSLLLLLVTIGYLLVTNKNVYCSTVCPFGATQECIGKLNKAKACKPKHDFFIWFARGLLWFTLILGLYYRNSASFSYEPFGMAFNMIGTHFIFVLTILIVLTSLFINKPWCQTLCPVHHFIEYIRFMKKWIKNSVKPTRFTEKKRGERHAS